jgi:hypothetical protein
MEGLVAPSRLALFPHGCLVFKTKDRAELYIKQEGILYDMTILAYDMNTSEWLVGNRRDE